MKYLLRGIDDLIIMNEDKFLKVINKNEKDILCVGTGLEDICNYKCIYCYAGDACKVDTRDMMSMSDIYKLIDEASELGVKSFIITGAGSQSEPLLSSKLVAVIKKLYSLNITPVIFTNISLLGEDKVCLSIHGCNSADMAKFLYQHKVSLMVSCDSLNEKTYDEIVGVKGSFSRFEVAMVNLKKAGFLNYEKIGDEIWTRIAISTVVTKSNIGEIENMKRCFHQNNWQYICKFPSIMGNASKNKDKFFDSAEVVGLKDKIAECSDKSQTLSLIFNENKYCLMNQLGIAINSSGTPLTCLSGNNAFTDVKLNVKNCSLEEIILRKKNKYSLNAGACPKKTKYYDSSVLN